MADNKTNLIVNYLPQTYTKEELFALFKSVGEVKSAKIICDKNTGYSYGYGFVEFYNETDAQQAIQNLNGYQIKNKNIKVALARPAGENIKGANVYVSNIPHSYVEEQVKGLFSPYGNIVQVRVLKDDSGMSRGKGFVLFETRPAAETAMSNLNNSVPEGGSLPLVIKFADDSAKKVRPPPEVVQGMYPMYPPRPRMPGGPMRGPGGNRFRYNPMWAPPTNFYGSGGEASYASGGGGYQAPRRVGQGRGDSYTKPEEQPEVTEQGYILYVYNIGMHAMEKDLWGMFSPYGTVTKVNVIWDHEKQICKGYGFVTMLHKEEADYAIQCLDGMPYSGKPLQVSFKTQK